jgi:hypothetical protein
MFCTIRQYEGCTDPQEVKRLLDAELLPAIRDMDGYHSYVAIDCGDGDVTSISLFNTEQQAESANEQVAKMIEAQKLTDLLPEEPVIMMGEVLVENYR